MAEDEGTSKRRSECENLEKKGVKPGRRSILDNPDFVSELKENEQLLEQWDQTWGKHNLDYVNAVKFPEEYVLKIKEEKEMWSKGLDEMSKKAEMRCEGKSNFDYTVDDGLLSTEQKASLRVIDSQINEYIKKGTMFLKEFEVYKKMQEVKLQNIENQRKMIEKIACSSKTSG